MKINFLALLHWTKIIEINFRTCLRYFLPPQWQMPKEEINKLSLEELVEFPMVCIALTLRILPVTFTMSHMLKLLFRIWPLQIAKTFLFALHAGLVAYFRSVSFFFFFLNFNLVSLWLASLP